MVENLGGAQGAAIDERVTSEARAQAMEGGAKERLVRRMAELLVPGENILDLCAQTKLTAPISPNAFLVTNKRFVIARARLLGGLDITDVNWVDVDEVAINEAMLHATLVVRQAGGTAWTLEGLEKAPARRVYTFARQAQEDSRKRRRDLELEEMKARAGGVQVHHHGSNGASNGEAPFNARARLADLKAMLEEGLLTPAEYEMKRAEILRRI